ncbi:MAG: hypothetical protein ACTSRP_28190, partial [Candidatus Helarchaeota archaeon]
PADANEDPDNDRLINLEEYRRNTNPYDPDTDNDFFNDYIDLFPNNSLFPWVFIISGLVITIFLLIFSIYKRRTKKSKNNK